MRVCRRSERRRRGNEAVIVSEVRESDVKTESSGD